MAEWFEVKVKFLRQLDNGLIKQVAEQYLIDSLSFTEAEGRVMLEVGEGMREVTVQKIARSNIKEVVFYGDTETWYRCKVQYSTVEEETEKEKKVTTYLLVNANDAKEAFERTEVHLKDMLVPFSIPEVKETKIAEVYQHVTGLRPGLRRMEKQPETVAESIDGTNIVVDGQKMTIRSVQPIIPPMLDTGCDMHTESVEASNPANGKPHEFEVPDESIDTLDQINSIFDFDLSTAQVQLIADQCRQRDANEFRTWLVASHGATPWQVSKVIEICKSQEQNA